MVPMASTMIMQMFIYVAVSLYPYFPSFPTRPRSASRDPETSRLVPKHSIYALRASFVMQLLKNFLMDFVV